MPDFVLVWLESLNACWIAGLLGEEWVNGPDLIESTVYSGKESWTAKAVQGLNDE